MAKKRDWQALRQQIQDSELDKDLKHQLLEVINEKKRYGLVWEESSEDAWDNMQYNLPVFTEDASKRLDAAPEGSPNHVLIEGDNLNALVALSYTHAGKIDVIYIDPPYNTGNKDFKYNDSYVDKEDAYYNSKWLSFMSKRLKIAKTLLKEDGVIFISIGDDEVAQLKLLCDEVFSRQYLGLLPRVAKSGSKQGTYFRPTKDYILVYCRNTELVNGFHTKEVQVKDYPLTDEDGRNFRKAHSLFQASLDPLRGCKNQRYYIEAPDGILILPPGNTMPLEKEDAAHVVPQTRADKVWRWSYQSYLAKKDRIMFSESKKSPLVDSYGNHTDWNVYEKKFEDEETDNEIDYNLPDDIIYDFLNSSASTYLNNMAIDFQFSKPWELVAYLIDITMKKSDILVLDFFAGSGTTLDAVMKMNDSDGGHRIAILATNNENNICQEVTYPRIAKVIHGYRTIKGKIDVPGLAHNNLRYYKTEFVPRELGSKNRRQLAASLVDILCIKNNIYKEEPTFGGEQFKASVLRYFKDEAGQMLVILDESAVSTVIPLIAKVATKEHPLKVYVYSDGAYAYGDEFHAVMPVIELCALPDAFLQVANDVLPEQKYSEAMIAEFNAKQAVAEQDPKAVEEALGVDYDYVNE